jgi:patatin-like phospholipase/acyl hydrolase
VKKAADGNVRILSMDGGPGPTMHIRILEEIERGLRDSGRSVLDDVTLFAGTSNGALLSLYLAWALTENDRRRTKKPMLEIVQEAIAFGNAYVKTMSMTGESVGRALLAVANLVELAMTAGKPPEERLPFLVRKLRELAENSVRALPLPLDLWSMRRFILGGESLRDGVALRGLLEKTFGRATLGDLKRNIVVVSFDTEAWAPRAFRNFGTTDTFGSKDTTRDMGLTLVDVGMCTSAFPLVMPVYGGQSHRGFLDGFFGVNNPVMTATSLAVRHLLAKVRDPFERIRILSLGAEQSFEERLIQRHGGLFGLLTQLASEDRDTRLAFVEMTYRERLAYLFSARHRREIQARLEHHPVGLGHRSYGWADFFQRPTFLTNMAIHGNDDEIWRVCRRLFRSSATDEDDPKAHRLKIRINLAREMWRIFLQGHEVELGDLGAEPRTADEKVNRQRVEAMRRWLDKHWFEAKKPPRAAKPRATKRPAPPALARRPDRGSAAGKLPRPKRPVRSKAERP